MTSTRSERITTDHGTAVLLEDLQLDGKSYSILVDNSQVGRRIAFSLHNSSRTLLRMVVEVNKVRFVRTLDDYDEDDDDFGCIEEHLCVVTDDHAFSRRCIASRKKLGQTFWTTIFPTPSDGFEYFYVEMSRTH